MTRRECVVRGSIASEHVVQLFDDAESRAEAVASFLFEGWRRGEPLLAGVRPDTWSAVSTRLLDRGCQVQEATASGRIVVLDAASTLASIVRNGHLIPERFGALIGVIVDRVTEGGRRPVRVYGELVDILAAQGELTCATRLEELWNTIAAHYPISLLCGYMSGHFGDPRSASLLSGICAEHDRAVAKADDLLASWLIADRLYVQPVPTAQ